MSIVLRGGTARRQRRVALFALIALLSGVTVLLGAVPGRGEIPREPGLAVIPDAAAPNAVLFGASAKETPGEVWGVADGEVARNTPIEGWRTIAVQGLAEEPTLPAGSLGGSATDAGGVALLARDANGEHLVTRDPGGQFHVVADPGSLLGSGTLFAEESPLVAALTEANGSTGALVVPDTEGPPQAVLHFNGEGWSGEPICAAAPPSPCQPPGAGFAVAAIGATGPANAWLLATDQAEGVGVELFSRSGETWQRRPFGGNLGVLFSKSSSATGEVEVSPRGNGQPLTVTTSGLWIDATLGHGGEEIGATLYYDLSGETVLASWCEEEEGEALAPYCTHPLESRLPSGGSRSFAWPPDGGPGDPYGTRTITGVGHGALLILEGRAFVRYAAGGDESGVAGAALTGPKEGWLSSGRGPLLLTPQGKVGTAKLEEWPLTLRHPLLAVAGESGSPVAEPDSEAIAVGEDGEIAHYSAEAGWTREAIAAGGGRPPRFRAVAWPVGPGPHAVGDNGAMWVGLGGKSEWTPDPGAPDGMEGVDLTGIAFFNPESENRSNRWRGWTVGTKGTLLGYGVGHWERYAVPEGVSPEVDFSSVTFAGDVAMATYKRPLGEGDFPPNEGRDGGLMFNTAVGGSGWTVDTELSEALGEEVPEKVAGLPDGGAVVATLNGRVFEREGADQPWVAAPRGPSGYPVALVAFREAGQIRAAISLGEAPDPYGAPLDGNLLRQTATGWNDEEHELLPLPSGPQETEDVDYPVQPDAVLGLTLSPDGENGWAVGGQTGEIAEASPHPCPRSAASQACPSEANREEIQTAAAFSYQPIGTQRSPTGSDSYRIRPLPGVDFAIAGGAQCAGPCADLSGTGIGPDRWVSHAFAQAREIEGLRAILYTGPGVAEGLGEKLSPASFTRESRRYAARLSGAANGMPVFVAPAASDLGGSGTLSTFEEAFSGFEAPLGGSPPGPAISPISHHDGAYSFDAAGTEGSVRVIVLDYSAPALDDSQSCWLTQQLYRADERSIPAIVVGNRSPSSTFGQPNASEENLRTGDILVGLGKPAHCPVQGSVPATDTPAASAYFFDLPGHNRAFSYSLEGRTLPVYGTGSLGYGQTGAEAGSGFGSTPGYLLAAVDTTRRQIGTNVAPVRVQLIPSVGQLALEADDGTLLTEGQPGLFSPVARRPIAGWRCAGYPNCSFSPSAYLPGLECGTECAIETVPGTTPATVEATGIPPLYTFSSSNPEVAQFVATQPGSEDQHAVLLDENGVAVASQESGLLCPLSPGTTTVTVSVGGISQSMPISVAAGEGAACGSPQPAVATGQPPAPIPASTPVTPPTPPTSPTPAPMPSHHPATPPSAVTPSVTPVPAPPAVIVPVPVAPPAPAIPPSVQPASLPAPAPVPAAAPAPVPVPAIVAGEEPEAALGEVHQMSAVQRWPRPVSTTALQAGEGSGAGALYALPLVGLLGAFGLMAAWSGVAGERRARLARAGARAR